MSTATPPRGWRSDECGFGWPMLGLVLAAAVLFFGVLLAGIVWAITAGQGLSVLGGALGGLLVLLALRSR